MRNLINFLTIVFCLLQVACGRQREPIDSYGFKPPKIVEAKTYKVPLEKTVPPKVIPVSGVKKIMAGKPEIVHLKSNVYPAKATRIVPAGAPKLFIPTGERFKLPKVVPAIDSPFIAGPPEIILLKEPFIKEIIPKASVQSKPCMG